MDHVTSVIGCLAAPLLGPRSDPGAPVPSPRPPWRWPSSLHSASARRRRRGSTRLAARASPLRMAGPVGPGSDPRSPSPRLLWRRSSSPRHGCARRRRRAPARRAARAPATSLPGARRARLASPTPSVDLRAARRAARPDCNHFPSPTEKGPIATLFPLRRPVELPPRVSV